MGGSGSAVKLKVGTLNYSGILTSPYEYYDEEDQNEKTYSQTFYQIVSQKYPDFKDQNPKKFAWKASSLGKIWKDRYSPLSDLMCGVNQKNNTLMTEAQFTNEWHRCRKENEEKLDQNFFNKKFPDQGIRMQQKQKLFGSLFEYDLFSYKAICKVIYGTQQVDKIKQNADKYIKERKPFFAKSFLDPHKKNEATKIGITKGNFDIFCIQEANENFIEAAKQGKFADNYQLVSQKGTDSLILLRKKIFSNFCLQQENHVFLNIYAKKRNIQVQDLKRILNFNGDSVFQAVNKMVIFSIHLSSKKQINVNQLIKLKQEIHTFKKLMPEYSLICCGDLNTQLNQDFEFYTMMKIKINVYPDAETQITANKKRTMMQQQRHKAEEHNFEAKDFVFSDLSISTAQVQLINGKQVKKDGKNHLLPTNDHPYDHYSVCATLLIPQHKIIDASKKKGICG